MKVTQRILCLLLLVSCAKESSNTSSSTSKSQGVLVDGPLSTKYVQKNKIQCALTDLEENSLYEIDQTKENTVQVPASLTDQIVRDLEKKGLVKKITPETFWLRLDKSLSRELNKVIINKKIDQNYFSYTQKMKAIAFAFNVYLENPTVAGVNLKEKVNGIDTRTVIFFNNRGSLVRDISLCKGYSLNSVSMPSNLINPSDISSKIVCKNRKGESVDIDGYRNKKITLTVKSKKLVESFNLFQQNLETLSNSEKQKVLVYNKNFDYDTIKFYITKSKRSRTGVAKLKLEFKAVGQPTIKIKNLRCKTQKDLKI